MMALSRTTFREVLDLRGVLLTIFLLVAYLLVMSFIDMVAGNLIPSKSNDLTVLLHYALVIWLLGALWIAYRRWLRVHVSMDDLQGILSGLTPDVVLVIDRDHCITMCSERVEAIFGYRLQEVLGKPSTLLFESRKGSGGNSGNVEVQLRQVGFHLGQAVGRKKNGERIPLEVVTGHIPGKHGTVLQLRDVTELMFAENTAREKAQLAQRLEANIQRLRETENSRDSLLQMIVHDMKTPLQVILGNVEMLLDLSEGEMVQEDRESLEGVAGHARRLVSMVNSMLDVSRLEAGEMPIVPAMHNLNELARAARDAVLPLAGAGRIQIESPEVPCTVYCDGSVTQRVIVNLLSNAIRHSPPDEPITITLTEKKNRTRLAVTDQGEGIPSAKQLTIFAKFVQVNEAGRPKGDAGTGIGLSFCKLAVEAQEGRIGLTSDLGLGSSFWFELPRKAPLQI